MKKQKKKRTHLTTKNTRKKGALAPKYQTIKNQDKLPFPINPLILINNDSLLDGQHRYKVCTSMNLPFKYMKLDCNTEDLYTEKFKTQFTEIINKQEQVFDEAMKKYNVPPEEIVLLTSSFFRIRKFYQYKEHFKGEKYWNTLLHSYQTSDNNRHNQTILKELFNSDEPGKDSIMTFEERKFLKNLPDEVTIYRGMTVEEQQSGDFGISWTLDKKVGEKFINSYWRNLDTNHIAERTVHELNIKKEKIIAVLLSRNELEVIYLHS